MTWRYQPVFVDQAGDITFGLIEIYLDQNDKLVSWTTLNTKVFAEALGNDIDDLRGEVTNMMRCAYAWKAVAYADLRTGMKFEREGMHEKGAISRVKIIRLDRNPVDDDGKLETWDLHRRPDGFGCNWS